MPLTHGGEVNHRTICSKNEMRGVLERFLNYLDRFHASGCKALWGSSAMHLWLGGAVDQTSLCSRLPRAQLSPYLHMVEVIAARTEQVTTLPDVDICRYMTGMSVPKCFAAHYNIIGNLTRRG